MTQVITFDIDGVIAEGSFVPKDQRTAWNWRNRKLLMPDANMPNIFKHLSHHFDIWLVSSRECIDLPSAQTPTIQWLMDKHIYGWKGVITNLHWTQKADACFALNSKLHFDDDPRLGDYMDYWLVDNPCWEENQKSEWPNRVRTWYNIMQVCMKDNHGTYTR